MQNTAIVIGASGLVGKALVNQLVDASHIDRIICLNRRQLNHNSPKVSHHCVNFEQLDAHSALLQGQYLFSCLGTTKKAAGSIAAQRKVDVDYQYETAKIAANNGIEHYLLVSAIGAKSSSISAYTQMKGELEQRVQQLPFKRISIMRPSLLLGQREQLRIAEKAAAVIMPLLCRLPSMAKYAPITGEQVAAILAQQSTSLHTGTQYL